MRPVTEEQVKKLLKSTEAVLEGHFELSSGRHSSIYIQCAKIFQYPDLTSKLAAELAKFYSKDQVDLVVSPAVGAIIWGYAVAEKLGSRVIFSERVKRKMAFRREFIVRPGENVLVVEDVVTTGSSVKEIINLVRKGGGKVLGVASLVDRGEEKVFGEPLHSLIKIKIPLYEAEVCPLCRNNVPISSPGSKWLKK